MSDFFFGIITGVCVTVSCALLADAGFGAAAIRRRLRKGRK